MIPRTHLTKDFTFARSALPCVDLPPTGTKPLMPSSFLAFFRASAHTLTLLLANLLLLLAEAFLDTILPVLLLTRSDLVNPDDVFCLRPAKTYDFARFPLAMMLGLLAFIFITFMAPALAFTALAFTALAFMALAFIAFMALAIGVPG